MKQSAPDNQILFHFHAAFPLRTFVEKKTSIETLLCLVYVYPQLKLFDCDDESALTPMGIIFTGLCSQCVKVSHTKNTLYNNTKQNPILSACQTLLHFNWNIDSEQTLPFNIIKYSHAILTATFISPQIYVSHVGFNAEKCYRRDSTGAKTIRINVRQEYQTRTMVI